MPLVIGGGNSGIPSHRVSTTAPSPAPNRYSFGSSATPVGAVNSSVGPEPTPRQRPAMTSVSNPGPAPMYEKPQASSTGGAVTMTIQLAEPILFLQGLDGSETVRRAAMLRGNMVLRVTKPAKIKAVTLTFRGRARTEWPEGTSNRDDGAIPPLLLTCCLGIPPRKSEYFEEKEIMQHTWPFFNAQFVTAELGHCADSFTPRKPTSGASTESGTGFSKSSFMWTVTPGEHKNTLRMTKSQSLARGESLPQRQPSVAQRGYKEFIPGDYTYNFELPLDSCLPETANVDLGSVKYELEGVIERPGAFRPNLSGRKEVVLVRVPSDANLEQTEPIAISRTWEDQLHYGIVISGKAFPLGASIPITFKLTPLAKVRCHRIKIFITENVEYSCKNKKVHRIDPVKRVQLFDKRAEAPATSAFPGSSVRTTSGGGVTPHGGTGAEDVVNGTDSLLGDLHGALNIGPTEMEVSVQLPGCHAKERDRLHFDTTYGNIQVRHWIKVCLTVSRAGVSTEKLTAADCHATQQAGPCRSEQAPPL